MTPETLAAMRTHALADYPRECCGLVLVVKGRERYVTCRNAADKPGEHFIIPAEDYAAAEDLGEITAVVHSHPDIAARASEGDRVACEHSGLPWYIVSVLRDGGEPYVGEIGSIRPEGYEAPLVGRAFHYGVLDCYSLCCDWYQREWGLALPDFPRRDQWWDDGHSDLYTQHFGECGFAPLRAGETLQVGDAILMQILSKNGVPNHAAIYIGNGHMLHHLYGRLSSRDVYGGMYRDYTRMLLRHESAHARLHP
jgi:proteasome lid subunit RPN8/RPN11